METTDYITKYGVRNRNHKKKVPETPQVKFVYLGGYGTKLLPFWQKTLTTYNDGVPII